MEEIVTKFNNLIANIGYSFFSTFFSAIIVLLFMRLLEKKIFKLVLVILIVPSVVNILNLLLIFASLYIIIFLPDLTIAVITVAIIWYVHFLYLITVKWLWSKVNINDLAMIYKLLDNAEITLVLMFVYGIEISIFNVIIKIIIYEF